MTFDIYAGVFTPEFDHEEAWEYIEALVERFQQSPEGQPFFTESNPSSWIPTMLDYGFIYGETELFDWTPAHIHELLTEVFPRKIIVDASEAPGMVREMRAFWMFLKREFGLENADACINALDEKAEQKLQQAMDDPGKAGMAKSLLMQGQERGYDMSTKEGIDAWLRIHQQEQLAAIVQEMEEGDDDDDDDDDDMPFPPGIGMGGMAGLPGGDYPSLPDRTKPKSKTKKAKSKRKMQKKSRKTNRKK
jgi:hypothetical protein